MKISEVQVGKEYGALDSPTRSYSSVDPRQVKVLEIVTVEKSTRNRYTSASGTSKTRKVKVLVLNGPEKKSDSWRWDAIQRSARGDELVIEARQLVGPWAALNKDILKRVAAEEQRVAREKELTDRFTALGFECSWDEANISVRSGDREEVEFRGREAVEKLLAKLEA